MTVISRRKLLAGPALLNLRNAADDGDAKLRHGVATLERRHGGRLGVAVLDTASVTLIAHRGGERFALCSTHKALAAAFVLARVDRKQESLARRILYAREDLVPHSPITEKHVGEGGLTVGDICEAAVTLSDNTAANLLLDSFGGPADLTAYLRSLGDSVTRLDRRETALNEAKPGDPRDTTTPVAMLETLRKTVLGTALSTSSREQLTAWLVANKTGSGANNATNDIAVLWPPGRAPIIVAAYYAEARASEAEQDAVLSKVGRLAAAIRGERPCSFLPEVFH